MREDLLPCFVAVNGVCYYDPVAVSLEFFKISSLVKVCSVVNAFVRNIRW